MDDYIKTMLEDFPVKFNKDSKQETPAGSNLLEAGKGKLLNAEYRQIFHTTVARGLYVSKRARLDIHQTITIVALRVRVPTESDWKKCLSKNVGEPAVLTATSARRWVSGVINSDFAGLDSEDSIGNPPDKTYELLTKTLAAVEESNKTTKTSVESLSEVVVAGMHGQASDKVPPNTVEKKWPTRLSYLKRVAGTTTSAQLPILWHELAKCKKHESIGIVQSLLDDEAKKLNLNLEFIVSARVIKSLVELEFCSRGDVEKGLNVFNSVCFQHYKNANAINDYNKSDYWLTGEKTTASIKDHQAHNKIKHAIFPRDPMEFHEMVNGMRVFYRVVFGKTHPLTAVYEKFAKNVDSIAQKMEVSQQERALERFLFGIYS
ncbi:unnamed protein product [Cylindrotheca closterium]|uniref:Uncharacterized protein n=1 Tax=Cylindrotheca closterium TaxID=2856 RepID=A0AAD2FFM7_9STRA|nr:unnamed protein product [Cylindrotheca closterium]